MNKKELAKIVEDVRKILELAEAAHKHLEKNRKRKAKKELKQIMNLDADEIARLHNGVDEEAAHQFLYECGIVFKDAKKILFELDSDRLPINSKELIKEIMELENHELIELQEEEQKENSLFREWTYLLDNFKLYHGTISTRLTSIQREGLDPAEREKFYEKGNLKRFIAIAAKLENLTSRDLFTLLDSRSEKPRKEIHLTFSREQAIDYAAMGVETFYQVTIAMAKIIGSDQITPKEKQEAQKIARPFINEMNISKPVVLHISLRAPTLGISWLQSFEKYKEFIYGECKGERPWFNPISLRLHPVGKILDEVIITKKIPFKYIKVEYVKLRTNDQN
ncbi:hypothetical protein CL617_01710 [archaeon]|nr:hypothetical protein [archaeon]|tara:strand:- start:66 stop:1076 length:1011 start_codon:yes stop_codon:yes gene_type:complete